MYVGDFTLLHIIFNICIQIVIKRKVKVHHSLDKILYQNRFICFYTEAILIKMKSLVKSHVSNTN